MSTKHTPQPTKGNPTQTTTQPNKTIKVSAWDLYNTEGTLEGITTAFDDIATALHLIRCGNLLPYQIQALTRITQTYACEWAEVADSQHQAVEQMIGGNHD